MKTLIKHTGALLLLLTVAAFTTPAMATPAVPATLYKRPHCGCCTRYAHYLDQHGFKVTIINTRELSQIQRKYGVPQNLEGCHTMLVKGYVVDGLVPVDVVKRMLREKPSIAGITLPGMPTGAPGMNGPGMHKQGPLMVYSFSNGLSSVYATK